MPEILILQHADWELPGAYGELLAERDLPSRVVRPDQGEAIPDPTAFSAVLAMGGPMSANDEAELPWLIAEKQSVAAAVRAGVPYFGTCLGAQLLAAAAGAPVYPGPHPEIGVHQVTVTPAADHDPLFAGLSRQLDVFQWHAETFDLPAGAVRLAGSSDYPNQAFRVGAHAYGLQFHLELTERLLATWLGVLQCRHEARQHLGPDGDQLLSKQVRAAESHLRQLSRQVFGRWLDVLGPR